MKPPRNPDTIAAGLSVPERVLLFCVASGTDSSTQSAFNNAPSAARPSFASESRPAASRSTSPFTTMSVSVSRVMPAFCPALG
jgi:hypothetical protein